MKIYNEINRLYEFDKKIRAKTFNIVDIQNIRQKNIQNIQRSVQNIRSNIQYLRQIFRQTTFDETRCRKTSKKIICFVKVKIVEHKIYSRKTSKTIF